METPPMTPCEGFKHATAVRLEGAGSDVRAWVCWRVHGRTVEMHHHIEHPTVLITPSATRRTPR